MTKFFGNRGLHVGFLVTLMFLMITTGISHATPSLRIFTGGQIADWHNEFNNQGGVSIGYEQNSATGPISYDTGKYQYYTSGVIIRGAARADYGSLGAYAYKFDLASGDITAGIASSARFTDTWTIGSVSQNNIQGNLKVWVDVEGKIPGAITHPGVSGGSSWGVQFTDSSNSAVESWDYSTNSGRQEYHGFLNQQINFTYGVPFEISIDFIVSAGTPIPGGENYADYLNTVTLNMGQTQVLDATGSVINDFTLTAASGHNYMPSSVPEPATLLLLGLGLMGLAGIRRKLQK
jgi:hypothetical protein